MVNPGREPGLTIHVTTLMANRVAMNRIAIRVGQAGRPARTHPLPQLQFDIGPTPHTPGAANPGTTPHPKAKGPPPNVRADDGPP